MEAFRRILSITVCLLIVMSVCLTPVSAETFTEETAATLTVVPAQLQEFAVKSALPFVKGWLQSSGKVGKYFESAEEIEQLQVGGIYKLCQIKGENDYSKMTALSDAFYVTEDWLMLACTPEGEAKWYALIVEKTNEYTGMKRYVVAREGNAVALGQALNVFEKINKTSGLNVTPVIIWYNPYETIVMEIVDGKEYVITAINVEPLDSSYTGITQLQYLPTGADAVNALREISAEPSRDEEGHLLLGGPRFIRLTAAKQPVVFEPAEDSKSFLKWPAIIAGIGALVVLSTGIWITLKAGKKLKR